METIEIYKNGNQYGIIYNGVYQLEGNKKQIKEYLEIIVEEVD